MNTQYLEFRMGDFFLVGSAPGQVIALALFDADPIVQRTLSLEEARALGQALCTLADDLAADAAAREWSKRKIAALTRNPSA